MALFRGRDRAGDDGSAESRTPDNDEIQNAAQPEGKPRAVAQPRADDPQSRSGRGSGAKNLGGDEVANIGKSISIKGDLTGNEDLVIEGKVEGKIDLPSNQLTIGANGTARAEVKAKTVVVVGRVSGNVSATERIEIQATGIVEGDVSAPRLIVAEGAVVNGSVSMGKAGDATKSAPSLQPPAPAPAPASATA